MGNIRQSFRLTNEPGGLGLSCTHSSLSLAGIPLLRKCETGLEPRSAVEIETLFRVAYGEKVLAADLLPAIDAVARALNRGDVAHAMIAAVLTKVPELDWEAAARLAHAEERLAKYSPDEPRDWHGQWTVGDDDDADQYEAPAIANDLTANREAFDQDARLMPTAFIIPQDDPGEDEPPDDRSALERKYDDLGPVEFAKQVIQFGWRLGVGGQSFTPEQRQDARAEYNFLQDRLKFWLAYNDKPIGAQANLLSAAQGLYEGAVNGKIIAVGGKGGDFPASMLAVATGLLATDNSTPGVRFRGQVGASEVEGQPVASEYESVSAEDQLVPSRRVAPNATNPIIEELTSTGELGETISNLQAKIDWGSGVDKGIDWENYNAAMYPKLIRLEPGAKAFDFFDEPRGEAVSDKALDPFTYSYINNPQRVYSKVKGYVDAAANYSKPRTGFDLEPIEINSRSLRIAVRKYISPAQWESLHRAVLYARSRGIKIKIWRID